MEDWGGFKEKMKILVHICCANCAIYPVKVLHELGGEVTGYFFNHNIHPYQEFRRRLDAVHEYAAQVALPVVINDTYALDEFLANVAGDPGQRCLYCYHSRLEAAARMRPNTTLQRSLPPSFIPVISSMI